MSLLSHTLTLTYSLSSCLGSSEDSTFSCNTTSFINIARLFLVQRFLVSTWLSMTFSFCEFMIFPLNIQTFISFDAFSQTIISSFVQ